MHNAQPNFALVASLLVLVVSSLGCVDPCDRLLETVCKETPHEQHCRSYRTKVSTGKISGDMCDATRKAYLQSLEEGSEP